MYPDQPTKRILPQKCIWASLILLIISSITYSQELPNTTPISSEIATELPSPHLELIVSSTPYDGLLYMTAMDPVGTSNSSHLIVADNTGTILRSKFLETRAVDLRVHPGGQISYYDSRKMTFILIDSNLDHKSEIPIQTYAPDMHEILILPNGNYLYFGKEEYEEDMRKYDVSGFSSATVLGKVILEYDKSGNTVFEWHTKDHLTPDQSHGESLGSFVVNPYHFNSIDIDLDDNLIISARNMDQILKIHRTTGEIMWRFGGKHNQFTLIGDSIFFSRQHSLRVLPNGNLLLFDNGTNNIPPISRACEYKLDTLQKTATLVWEFRHTPDLFSSVMGSVQRLANDNILIGWGSEQSTCLTEVDRKGNTKLEMRFSGGNVSYRAYKFPEIPEPKSFSTNKSVNVLSPNLGIYPNPSSKVCNVSFNLERVSDISTSIIDELGRTVMTRNRLQCLPGYSTVSIDIASVASGVYTVKLQTADAVSYSKLVIQ